MPSTVEELYGPPTKVEDYVPRLTVDSYPAQWAAAFQTRRDLILLLQDHLSLFPALEAPELLGFFQRYLCEAWAHGDHDRTQSRFEHAVRRGQRPRPSEAAAVLSSLNGGSDPAHPFLVIMHSRRVDEALQLYVKDILARMIKTWQGPAHAGATVATIYLVATHWEDCDPLQKAAGVVEAKKYCDRMRRLIASRPRYTWESNALGHSHLPSLTSRQARRSAMTAGELRERWG